MSASVQLDAKLFHKRAKSLLHRWTTANDASDGFSNADAILVPVGAAGEDSNPYQKSTALQTWLLGYEFPNTIMLITPDAFYFVASSSKAAILKALDDSSIDSKVPLTVLRRTKDAAESTAAYQKIVDAIKGSKQGTRVGGFPKDTAEGKFIDEWSTVYSQASDQFEAVDVSAAIAQVLAVKDTEEIKTIRTACKVTSQLMHHYFADEMAGILDEEKTVTHEKLSEMTENGLWEPKVHKTAKIPSDVNMDMVDWCYAPIIQSGGTYDLRSSAMSNNDALHAGTVLCSFGVRYKSYCSNVGRTYMIDPSKGQEKNYKFLLEVQQHAVEALKEGVPTKNVYLKTMAFIRRTRPELEKHFVKNCGFATGIEFRESAYLLNAKNERPLQSGMVFNLIVGFQNLENPKASDAKGKTYALLLIDTVLLNSNGSGATLLTDCPKGIDEVAFFFKDEGDDGQDTLAQARSDRAARPRTRDSTSQQTRSAVLSSKFRSEEREDDSAEERRREHQRELANQKQAEGLARFPADGTQHSLKQEVQLRRFESYKREGMLPRDVQRLQIVVDAKNDSVVLPIYGMAVPIHISTIKNVSKSEEGRYLLLRVNFVTPGQVVGKKENLPFDDVHANFLRSVTFRSTDVFRLTEVFQQIQDLKKNQTKKEAERKEMADIVVQDKLVEARGRRPIRLPDVFARPDLGGKRVPGELEIHSNGLRYQHPLRSDQRIDILFNNVQHLFFQPCDHELIVLLHLHLKNPVMIGKKKTRDVQFYREASDAQFDETGNRRRRFRYGDEDELEAEQEERRRRSKLNQEFRKFAQAIAEQSGQQLEVDTPLRDLGFNGVPFRSNVLLQPTTECLVQLTDMPFLVITMAEVEIAHLERVQFGLKNFDLVLVLKDFAKPPVHINTIPMAQLDHVKEWLDSMDVLFSEGPVNLNWSAIMKTVQADPAIFFKEGGWGFLGDENASDADSDDEEDEESAFEVSEEELAPSSSSEEDSEFSDAVATESDGSMGESDESGEDWDALEEKARRYDDKKRSVDGPDSDEERANRSKKRSRR